MLFSWAEPTNANKKKAGKKNSFFIPAEITNKLCFTLQKS
jgi:hypothetical protein